MAATMQAIVQDRYGPLEEVLQVAEVDRPTPTEGQVLVRVRAASIHVGDVFMARGVPYLFRPLYGLRRPKIRVPGTDLAGTVEAVGPGVTQFRSGDAVLGWSTGAFAEYAVVTEDALVAKPDGISFDQAAALGVSAMTALQALRDQLEVGPGQLVLVTGASGGVGTFAVQLAKAFGAEVTAVCSSRNVDLVRSIGADHVVDYTREDYRAGGPRYDRILDNVGNHPMASVRRTLRPGGLLLSNGAPVGGWVGGVENVARAALASIFDRRQARPFMSTPTAEDLRALLDLAAAGTIRPVLDRTFPLSEGARAMAHVGQGHARGTSVLSV